MKRSGVSLEHVSRARIDQASATQRGEDRHEGYGRGDPFRPGSAAEGGRYRGPSPLGWARFQDDCRRFTLDSYHGNG